MSPVYSKIVTGDLLWRREIRSLKSQKQSLRGLKTSLLYLTSTLLFRRLHLFTWRLGKTGKVKTKLVSRTGGQVTLKYILQLIGLNGRELKNTTQDKYFSDTLVIPLIEIFSFSNSRFYNIPQKSGPGIPSERVVYVWGDQCSRLIIVVGWHQRNTKSSPKKRSLINTVCSFYSQCERKS